VHTRKVKRAEPVESNETPPCVEHAAHIDHPGQTMVHHVIQRRTAGKHGAAVAQQDPAIGHRLVEVDVQSLVNADREGDAREGVLVELPALRVGLPGMVGRGSHPTEQDASLRFGQVPPVHDVDKGTQGSGTQLAANLGFGQIGRHVERIPKHIWNGQSGGSHAVALFRELLFSISRR